MEKNKVILSKVLLVAATVAIHSRGKERCPPS